MSPPPMSKSNLHPWENGSWLMIKSSLVRPHLGQSGCHSKSLEALLDGMKYVEIFIGKPFNQASCVTADLSALRQTEPPALRLHALLCWFSLKGLYAHLLLVYFIWTNFKGRLTGKLYIFPYYWRGICSFVVREIIIYIFFVIEKAFVYLIFSLWKHLWDLCLPVNTLCIFLLFVLNFSCLFSQFQLKSGELRTEKGGMMSTVASLQVEKKSWKTKCIHTSLAHKLLRFQIPTTLTKEQSNSKRGEGEDGVIAGWVSSFLFLQFSYHLFANCIICINYQ